MCGGLWRAPSKRCAAASPIDKVRLIQPFFLRVQVCYLKLVLMEVDANASVRANERMTVQCAAPEGAAQWQPA